MSKYGIKLAVPALSLRNICLPMGALKFCCHCAARDMNELYRSENLWNFYNMTLAKNEYGTTWWGERWLNALTGIDYENRIPRGFAYANEGKVNSPNLDPDQTVRLSLPHIEKEISNDKRIPPANDLYRI